MVALKVSKITWRLLELLFLWNPICFLSLDLQYDPCVIASLSFLFRSLSSASLVTFWCSCHFMQCSFLAMCFTVAGRYEMVRFLWQILPSPLIVLMLILTEIKIPGIEPWTQRGNHTILISTCFFRYLNHSRVVTYWYSCTHHYSSYQISDTLLQPVMAHVV